MLDFLSDLWDASAELLTIALIVILISVCVLGAIIPLVNASHKNGVELCLRAYPDKTRDQCEFEVTYGRKR